MPVRHVPLATADYPYTNNQSCNFRPSLPVIPAEAGIHDTFPRRIGLRCALLGPNSQWLSKNIVKRRIENRLIFHRSVSE